MESSDLKSIKKFLLKKIKSPFFDVDYKICETFEELLEECKKVGYKYIRKPNKIDDNGFCKTSKTFSKITFWSLQKVVQSTL